MIVYSCQYSNPIGALNARHMWQALHFWAYGLKMLAVEPSSHW